MTRARPARGATFALLGLCACTSRAALPAPVTPIHATDRASFPAAPASPTTEVPQEAQSLATFTLDNGLTVFVLPRAGSEHVTVRYAMTPGAESGAASAQGTSTLALQLALERMRRHQRRLDTGFAGYADRTGAQLMWSASPATLESSLEVLASVARGAPVDAEAVRSGANAQLNRIDRELNDAQTQATLHARRVLYGDRHALGQSTSGTRETVTSLTFGGLELHQRMMFAPDGCALILVGDLSPEQARPIVQRQLGGLLPGTAYGRAYTPERGDAERRTRGVVTPGHVAHVAHAFEAPELDDVDLPAFSVLSMITAELIGSRVRDVLREQSAYTYDVSGHYEAHQRQGTWTLRFAVEGKDLGRALHAVDAVLARLAREAISEDELVRARVQLEERRAVALEDPYDAAEIVAERFLEGLSPERVVSALRLYGALIDQVTTGDVQRVAARYLRKERRGTAVAGDIRQFHRGLTGWDRAIEWLVPAP